MKILLSVLYKCEWLRLCIFENFFSLTKWDVELIDFLVRKVYLKCNEVYL